MSTKDHEFLKTLRATFKVEAAEHLQVIATGLLELEKTPAPEVQRSLVETVFRAAHSLKGAARAVDFIEIESFCQSLEDAFAAWKRAVPPPAEFDAAHRTVDAIANVMSAPEAPRGGHAPGVKPLFDQAARHSEGAVPAPASVVPPALVAEQKAFSAGETVRITVAKLDARLVEAEEMLTAKLTTGQRAEDLRELAHRFAAWRNEWTVVEPEARAFRQVIDRPDTTPVGHPLSPGLARLLEFLDWNRDHLKSLESKVASLTRTAEQDHRDIGKLVDDLLADSKKLLLLPFGTLAASFPKLVRDLCRDQGKEADLVIRGEEVEIDKRILEEMKDPLIHLLRNCVDHGVETPELRVRMDKSSRATITLAVSPVNGSKVEILVADDGRGIDTEKVKASAIKHGFLPANDTSRLSDTEVQTLIFQPEVSTSPIITRVSGRGLGLAIVRERAEKLGGSVSVESQPQQGTGFRILLPSMLSTFRGILIEVEGRRFVLPTFHVERVARVTVADVQTVEGRETVALSGRVIALVRLADVLELPRAESKAEPSAAISVLILGLGDQRIAFVVDAVLDEQEVLVKPLRRPLSRVRNIAGATVLGSGHVAPILNVSDLLKSARKTGSAAARVAPKAKPADAKAVLVVEDSITSRMLIKSILESAGYNVKTAVDGMEAFTLLRAEKFALVVSDVEMPRLNGFDLTARIRADKKLADLPVVLVTALETRENRERGIDVGANAYIIKSNFDQSDLLDAVRRLV
jgi:two-component system chemotaxis sensor kinase CheA